MENSIKLIKGKLGMLELTRKQIEANQVDEKCLIENENQREMEKTFKSRKVKIDEIYELILKVQEEKLVAGESKEDVELWGNEVTERLKYIN